tara:strand:- start:1103 stop:1291 length:189 start_codon:yes stop_codon:yes gene_type:complete
MKVLDLWSRLYKEMVKNPDVEDYEVIVAFDYEGNTVTSSIRNYSFNGKTLQLNEEDFVRKLR